MTHQPSLIYEFGDFSVDAARRQLRGGDGVSVPLAAKALETLLYLVGRSGTVLDKDELLGAIWPDAIVEENNLTQAVSSLRRALGESRAEHRYIMTVPGRGYCFVADVTTRQPHSETPTAPTSSAAIDSLAVLPLDNMSDDPDMEYLSDGITESLINALSQMPKLRVVSRSTVFRYKGKKVDLREIGQQLGVRAVLTGRVRRVGDRLIIGTELIDVANDTQLWGEHHNRRMSDVLEMQEEIAREIAEKLRLKLSGKEKQRLGKRHTNNPEAYQLYLKGRYFWNKRSEDGIRRSIEYFNQSIALDPSYALAYAGLADSFALLSHGHIGRLPPKDVYPRAKAAAMKALEIDDTLAEAHTSLGFVKKDYEWDFAGAEREFKRAIELNPNYATAYHWYAENLVILGRLAEAITVVNQAQELDPLSLPINAQVGWVLYHVRQYDQAIEQYRRTLK